MLFRCIFVAWLFLFSFSDCLQLKLSKSHPDTLCQPQSHMSQSLHAITHTDSRKRTLLDFVPSPEPPRFTPAEAMVPSVITPTLHSCPTCVYPIIQTTDAPACIHTHTPTSGDHKLTVKTPWTSLIFTKLTNTSSVQLKRCITFFTSLKEVCAFNVAFTGTHREIQPITCTYSESTYLVLLNNRAWMALTETLHRCCTQCACRYTPFYFLVIPVPVPTRLTCCEAHFSTFWLEVGPE